MVAAAVEQALVVHLAVGLVDVFREMGLEEVLGERRMGLDQPVDVLLAQQVADRIVDRDDRRLLAVLAHEGNDAEAVPLTPEIDDHILAVPRFEGDPDTTLLDDPERVARWTILLQDDHVLGVELQ